MVSFATEFPVDGAKSSADFLGAIKEWILGSPYTRFAAADLANLPINESTARRSASEQLDTLAFTSGADESCAVRYIKLDPVLEWQTTIVFSRTALDAWVGIRVSCESKHPSSRLPPAKKPVLVRTLISKLGGGKDGFTTIRSDALRMEEAEVDIAIRGILGPSNCRLPIVYVSTTFFGDYCLNVDTLSSSLAGMAHVFVEPSRTFSASLMSKVDGQNVYGGTVGIYWPDGAGRRSFFFGPTFSSSDDLLIGIVDEITTALANRRPMARLTWGAVQEAASRQAIVALQKSGSREVEKYVDAFDQEMAAKNEQLNHAEIEIARLQAEIRRYEARTPVSGGIVLTTGSERELYEGEIEEIVREALGECGSRVPNDSRRHHVLDAVSAANLPGGESKARRERLKDLLRGYRTMDARIQQGLRELGFHVSEEGKHFKLLYQADDRYTFTLPKSGSDHRGGLNAASDIGRLLF